MQQSDDLRIIALDVEHDPDGVSHVRVSLTVRFTVERACCDKNRAGKCRVLHGESL